MKYTLLFGIMSVGWLAIAILRGGWWWVCAWPAMSFALVACAYGGAGVRIFGKRADGRMSIAPVVLLFPFLMLTWGLWWLQRRTGRIGFAEVAPGVWVSRRPVFSELPPDAFVVDATAEFFAARGVCREGRYLCCPMLDNSVPSPAEFCRLVSSISNREDYLFVHCAQGHGRSVMVVCAVLLARRLADSVDEALQRVRQVRPRAKLGPTQRKLLEDWFAGQMESMA